MQAHNPRIVTDGLIYHLDPTNGGKGGSKIITKPTQISDCVLWLDADDKESIVLNGATVSNWLDKSGGGDHVSQSTSSYQPTYVANSINGRGAIDFDGTDNFLTRAHGDVNGLNFGIYDFCLFIAYENTVVGSNAGVIGKGEGWDSPDWGYMIYHYVVSGFAKPYFQIVDNDGHSLGNGAVTAAEGAVIGAPNISFMQRKGDSSNGDSNQTATRYINGRNTTNNSSGGIDDVDDPASGFHIGKANEDADGGYLNGRVFEVIMYSKALTDAERQSIEYYLSRKWAIPLSDRTPPANLARPANNGEWVQNGGFDSDVDWTHDSPAPGSGTAISNGVATVVANGSIASTTNNMVLRHAPGGSHVAMFRIGRRYKVSFDVRQTVGSGAFQMGNGYQAQFQEVVTGTMTRYSFIATPSTWGNVYHTFLSFGGVTSGDTFELDNVSVVEVSDVAQTTQLNTFYFPNPGDINCDMALEHNNAIVVADNLPWTMEFWVKRHSRGGPDVASSYHGVWGNTMSASAYHRLQFDVSSTADKLILVDDDNNNSALEITNIADIDCLHKWKHVVLAFDGTTDSTTAGCVRQYINGQESTPSGEGSIALRNADSGITIRRLGSGGTSVDLHSSNTDHDTTGELIGSYDFTSGWATYTATVVNATTVNLTSTNGWWRKSYSVHTNSSYRVHIVGTQQSSQNFYIRDHDGSGTAFTDITAASGGLAANGQVTGTTFDVTGTYIPDEAGVMFQGYGATGNIVITTLTFTLIDDRLEGELGNFRVYDKQLSHAEVLQNYNAQRAKYENKKMSFAAPDNLLLYLDAQSGTSSNYYADGTWYDISGGTANNATRANATFTDEGVKYYDFDGTGDYFDCGDVYAADQMTLCAWVKLNVVLASQGSSYPQLFGKRGADTQRSYFLAFQKGSNKLYWEIKDAAGVYYIQYSTKTDWAADTWYYCVVTYTSDSGIAKMYIDGVEDAGTFSPSQPWSLDPIPDTSSTCRIGGGNYYLNGGMANAMFYDVTLSADQIAQNYNYFKHRFGR